MWVWKNCIMLKSHEFTVRHFLGQKSGTVYRFLCAAKLVSNDSECLYSSSLK